MLEKGGGVRKTFKRFGRGEVRKIFGQFSFFFWGGGGRGPTGENIKIILHVSIGSSTSVCASSYRKLAGFPHWVVYIHLGNEFFAKVLILVVEVAIRQEVEVNRWVY